MTVERLQCVAKADGQKLLFLLLLLTVAARLPGRTAAYAGIAGSGKLSCEGEGAVCFTQAACCENYSCLRASQASYGRCAPNQADMRLAEDAALTDSAETTAAALSAVRATLTAHPCCKASTSSPVPIGGRMSCGNCERQSRLLESLFEQYYSAFKRKRQ
uniref:Secreted protein n=1 Tax=Macrostomum lignano TaxID=282301 RepID=A0A1I8FQ11_9PLAT